MSSSEYKLLMQYERSKRSGGTTVSEFTSQCDEISSRTQLELIALDIEIRLRQGNRVRANDYLFEYPQFQKQIEHDLREVSRNFVATFCPMQDRFDMLPCTFAHYQVQKEIGRGGMGVVYEATDVNSGQIVALKIPFIKDVCLQGESEILKKVRHDGVNTVLSVGSYQQTPYLATEFLGGVTLKEMLKIYGTLEPCEAVRIVAELSRSLHWIHQQNVIHFDIKTSNIIMHQNQNPVLTDFGIAVLVDENKQLLGDSLDYSRGSPCYMAPEVFDRSFGSPGFQSDVYSLGVVLYELLTGVTPFAGAIETLGKQVCHYPPARPSDFNHVNIDTELERICLDALQKNESKRTASMKVFKEQLSAWLQQNEWSITSPRLRVA